MQYPEETITTNKQGKKEVRVLQEMGKYVKYNYLDLKTGKETSKYSLILRSEGKQEQPLCCTNESRKKPYYKAGNRQ